MRRPLVAVVVALGALAFAGSAQACSCAQAEPAEALRRSDAAIVGELVEVIPRNRFQADYRYRVQHVYKPARGLTPGEVISVRSARDGAACGLPGGVGRRFGLLLDAPPVVHRIGAEGGAHGERRWRGGLCGVLAPRTLRSAARDPLYSQRDSRGSIGDCAS